MGKIIKRKFYRPGTLEVPGTKIVLKTQPYTNGVIFNTSDPISSFREYIALIKLIVENYEIIALIPGMEESLNNMVPYFIKGNDPVIGKAKLLLDYLSESPTELILKDQMVDENILHALEARDGQ